MSDYSSYMWSVPDWRTDEMYMALDNREQGIYRNLIDECWVSGSIINNVEILARFVHEPLEYFALVWVKISKKFRPISNGERLISGRLEQDRRRLMLNAKFNEKRARKAAETRWNKERAEKDLNAPSINVASPEHAFEHCQTQTHTKKEESSPVLHDSKTVNNSTLHYVGNRTRKTSAPAELPITDQMRQWAHENGITANLDAETAAMLDHHRGKGNLHQDWTATWRSWMRNWKKFNQGANGNGRHETKAEALIRKQKESGEQVRELLRRSAGDGDGSADSTGTDDALHRRLIGSE